MSGRETSTFLPLLSSLQFPEMLYGSLIRSDVSCASQVHLKTMRLPAGYHCIEPSDVLAENMSLSFGANIPIFADSTISYRGEPIGLLVGPDPALCDELATSAAADYEEVEPQYEWESFASSQIAYKHTAVHGDPDKAFEKAARVERAVYRNGIFDHHYSEPMGALANWEYDKMAVYCASQWPSQVRGSVASAMNVSESDIVVKPTDMGKALDGRLWFPSLTACQAAIAARLCKKPVKILYTREEDYLFTPKQARSSVTIASATDGNGKLQALDIKLIINIGAYNPLAQELVRQAMAAITGIYACPVIRLEAYAIRTTTVPLGALGSMGSTHAFFSIEAHINHLAKVLQKTPAEIKSINMLTKGSSNFGALPLDADVPFQKIHKKLEGLSDYQRKYASYELVKKRDPGYREGIVRGIALTVGYQTDQSFFEQPAMNSYAVETRFDRNLDLVINTQAAIGSESLRTMWKTTAASVLSMPEDKIHFLPPTTDSTIPCGPMTLSRGASTINKLVERTCKSIQKKRFRETLPISVKAQTRIPRKLAWNGSVLSGQPFDSASWCGTAVEIEIDSLTGEPRALAVWMVIDAGRIVSREHALSSLRSSIINALNLCIGGDFDPESRSETRYIHQRSLRLGDTPLIEIEFLESDRATTARGLGELPFITIPAAFYSALTQAIGIEPRQLPLRGSEILRLLEAT